MMVIASHRLETSVLIISMKFSLALSDINVRRVSNNGFVDVDTSGISSGTLTSIQ